METALLIAVLVFSVIVHEISHGLMAYRLGDPTAKYAGRLTLNPLPHIDPIGSLAVPFFLWATGAPFLFGWAKPVPYNPYNLTGGGRFAEPLVALAGPLANMLLAVFFAVLIRFAVLPDAATTLVMQAVLINVLLALFNLLPVPPLDGSKIIEAVLPSALRLRWRHWTATIAAWGMLGFGLVLLVVFFFSQPLFALVWRIAAWLVGAGG